MNLSKDDAISPEYEDASWQPVVLPHTYNFEDSAGRMTAADGVDSVSYTHLTLPTILRV